MSKCVKARFFWGFDALPATFEHRRANGGGNQVAPRNPVHGAFDRAIEGISYGLMRLSQSAARFLQGPDARGSVRPQICARGQMPAAAQDDKASN